MSIIKINQKEQKILIGNYNIDNFHQTNKEYLLNKQHLSNKKSQLYEYFASKIINICNLCLLNKPLITSNFNINSSISKSYPNHKNFSDDMNIINNQHCQHYICYSCLELIFLKRLYKYFKIIKDSSLFLNNNIEDLFKNIDECSNKIYENIKNNFLLHNINLYKCFSFKCNGEYKIIKYNDDFSIFSIKRMISIAIHNVNLSLDNKDIYFRYSHEYYAYLKDFIFDNYSYHIKNLYNFIKKISLYISVENHAKSIVNINYNNMTIINNTINSSISIGICNNIDCDICFLYMIQDRMSISNKQILQGKKLITCRSCYKKCMVIIKLQLENGSINIRKCINCSDMYCSVCNDILFIDKISIPFRVISLLPKEYSNHSEKCYIELNESNNEIRLTSHNNILSKSKKSERKIRKLMYFIKTPLFLLVLRFIFFIFLGFYYISKIPEKIFVLRIIFSCIWIVFIVLFGVYIFLLCFFS